MWSYIMNITVWFATKYSFTSMQLHVYMNMCNGPFSDCKEAHQLYQFAQSQSLEAFMFEDKSDQENANDGERTAYRGGSIGCEQGGC